MKKLIRFYVYELVKLASRRRMILSLLLYAVGIILSVLMWTGPFARPNNDDDNSLNPGHTSPRLQYSYSQFGLPYPKEVDIVPTREDGSQIFLIVVVEQSDTGRPNSLAVEVGKTMLNLNRSYISKQIKIIFAINESKARLHVEHFTHYYSESAIAAIILSEGKFPKRIDLVIDALGPYMLRPILNVVTCILQNCKILDVHCHLFSDQEARPSVYDVPLHWMLNKRKIDSMTLLFNSQYHHISSNEQHITYRQRKLFELQVQRYCQLVETQLRSLNNINGPFRESTYTYLIPNMLVTYSNMKFPDYDQLFVGVVNMMLCFLCFPVALLIASLPSLTSEQNVNTLHQLGNGIYILAISNLLFPWLTSLLGCWPLKTGVGYVLYILGNCFTLDILVIGKWSDLFPNQLRQLGAFYLCAFAIEDYLGAVKTAYFILPMLLTIGNYNKRINIITVLLSFYGFIKLQSMNVSQLYLALIANVFAPSLAWLIRQ
ncbi:hypothetical protein GJ496_007287 [Pomphorhynchus laevis]|nr:hypothetical protein GJ496_007287 [Pomphorhynchus laevis]